MNYQVHGHRHGDKTIPPNTLNDVCSIIKETIIQIERGKSSEIKTRVLDVLRQRGWSEEVSLSPHSGITITSQKGDVGLCFQTGNMSRMYADLMKLQALYTSGSIKTGILLVPTALSARVLGSNLANYERLTRELSIFERVITIPLAIIGME